MEENIKLDSYTGSFTKEIHIVESGVKYHQPISPWD
jgi:hypothetical protein